MAIAKHELEFDDYLTTRITRDDKDFLDAEAEKLSVRTGKKANRSDVVRTMIRRAKRRQKWGQTQ